MMTFIENIIDVIGPENLIAIAVGIEAMLVLFFIWFSALAKNPVKTRAKSILKRQEDLKAGLVRQTKTRSERKITGVGLMSRFLERLNLLRTREADKVADLLAQAGWRSKDGIVAFIFFKISLPFVFGAGAVIWLYVLELSHLSPLMRAVMALGVTVVGAYSSEIFVKNAATKRKLELQRGLPDALDLMVICAEAGLSLDAALKRVTRELGHSYPALSDELGLTAVELGFLSDRRQALENLNRRTDLPSLRAVVNTLIQTEKYGTPLAHSLRVLSAEFRTERMLKAEEKAAKLPATLTVPMIVFILPTLFVVLIGPAVLQALDSLAGR